MFVLYQRREGGEEFKDTKLENWSLEPTCSELAPLGIDRLGPRYLELALLVSGHSR